MSAPSQVWLWHSIKQDVRDVKSDKSYKSILIALMFASHAVNKNRFPWHRMGLYAFANEGII